MSLGCGDTNLIPSNPATSCWNASLENQSPSESLESTLGTLGLGGSSFPHGTRYELCHQHLG